MSLTDKQVEIIKTIIQVFETGKATKNYGTVTILTDGAGISYGAAQATDDSGSLDAIVMRYLDLNGIYSKDLEPYLSALQHNLSTKVDPKNPPTWALNLESILKKAGDTDPKMALAQDQIFDENYWQPAVNQCNAMQLKLPLSYAVVYDTCINSGPAGVSRIRKLFPEVPPASSGDEKKWTEAYIRARRVWLASMPITHNNVYRMAAFSEMIADDNWNLDKSITVLGVKIQ